MKSRGCFVLLCICVCTVWVQAAHFEYDSSLLRTQVGGYANNATEFDPPDDAGTPWRDQNLEVDADAGSISAWMGSMVSTAWGEQSSTGEALLLSDRVTLKFQADAEAESDDSDSSVWSYAGNATVEPGTAAGIYYTIVGDGAESNGDVVTMTVSWFCALEVTGTGTAAIDGGFSPDGGIYITVNDTDDVPDPAHTLYSHPKVEIGDDSQAGPGSSAVITARVGDVVGIFFGNGVDINLSDESGYGLAYSYAELSLIIDSVEPVQFDPRQADFNGDGKVDMSDLARFMSAWLWEDTGAANDECADAIEITLDNPVTADNTGATGGAMDSCSGDNDNKDIWYCFENTTGSDLYVDVILDNEDQSLFDSTLSVWDGCGGMEIGCDENGGTSEVVSEVNVQAGERIYIRVAGCQGIFPDEGECTLIVTESLF